MRIKDISLENRPRERMKKHGISVLSDAEVLALILQKGTRTDNVIDISNRLITKYGLEKLSSLSLTELSSINGIGNVKAMQILAAFELASRIKVINHVSFNNAQQVFEYMHPKLANLKQEHFIVLLLDSKNKLIKEETVFIGTLDSALIHPREVFKVAIRESAASIILVHNHPSGDCEPSDKDLINTGALIKLGNVLGIKIIDHVILGKENYWCKEKINY